MSQATFTLLLSTLHILFHHGYPKASFTSCSLKAVPGDGATELQGPRVAQVPSPETGSPLLRENGYKLHREYQAANSKFPKFG